jgi:hypothetical protein
MKARAALWLCLLVSGVACASAATRRDPASGLRLATVPIGQFFDDYGSMQTVSATEWRQGAYARYQIVAWDTVARYLIARNDSANPTAGGRWTRIDWVPLDGMPPWRWGFCFSAYGAETREAAEATRIARPETPRTGCNGHPYSRLRPTGVIETRRLTPSADAYR